MPEVLHFCLKSGLLLNTKVLLSGWMSVMIDVGFFIHLRTSLLVGEDFLGSFWLAFVHMARCACTDVVNTQDLCFP